MKAFRLIASCLQMFCQFIHHALGIAEDQRPFRIIIIDQTAQHLFLILSAHLIVCLFDQGNRHLFRRHPDVYRILLIRPGKLQNRFRHGSRKQSRLSLLGHLLQDRLNILTKPHIQHLVCLIKHYRMHIIHLQRMSAHVIHHTPRCSHDDLCAAFQVPDLSDDILPSIDREYLDPMHIFGKLAKFLCRLHSQLSGRAQNHRLQIPVIRVNLLQNGNPESRSLTGTSLGLSNHILSGHKERNRLFLNRRHLFISHFPDSPQNSFIDLRIFISHMRFCLLLLC